MSGLTAVKYRASLLATRQHRESRGDVIEMQMQVEQTSQVSFAPQPPASSDVTQELEGMKLHTRADASEHRLDRAHKHHDYRL
jgi:hypothetical protein